MNSRGATRWIVLWVIELSEFNVQYHPRMAIKGQVIADFIVEFTNMEDQVAGVNPQRSVHRDGSPNRLAGRAGIILHSLEGDEVECMIRLDFPTINNVAEYEALIVGLDLAKAAGATNVVLYCDSQVVTNQINRDYECKGE